MFLIATVGPNTKDKKILKDIIKSGANSLRLNFSHGDLYDFERIIDISRGLNENINIMQDLCGRKIRVSNLLSKVIKIYNKEDIIFCGEDIYKVLKDKIKTIKIIPLNVKSELLNYKSLKSISMKDNTMQFKIISISEHGILTKVTKGGIVRAGKGCNIKGFSRSKIPLSDKDKEDLDWGIKNRVDIICQSFVEDSKDIEEVKDYILNNSNKDYKPRIWAKIETLKGIKNIDKILSVVDGIVIGRGDLIPETSIVTTPIYEDKIVTKISKTDKDIIIATHVLESIGNGRNPEISEVESIYNYIKNGVNGFLLAGETSVSKMPIETVRFLSKVLNKYERIV